MVIAGVVLCGAQIFAVLAPARTLVADPALHTVYSRCRVLMSGAHASGVDVNGDGEDKSVTSAKQCC